MSFVDCDSWVSTRAAASISEGDEDVRQLPHPAGTLDLSGQGRVPNIADGRQAPRRGTAPLETGLGRRPVKQGHVPGVGVAAALVVDETVIGRAPCRDQPT